MALTTRIRDGIIQFLKQVPSVTGLSSINSDVFSAGEEGSAGRIDIYPSTANSGLLRIYSEDHNTDVNFNIRLDSQTITGLGTERNFWIPVQNGPATNFHFAMQAGRGAPSGESSGKGPVSIGADGAIEDLFRLGATATEGLVLKFIEEEVELDGSASNDLGSNVPAGAVITGVQANLQTAVTATTAVKVGIGTAADPDKYGKTSGLTKNLKIDTIPDWAVLGSEEDIKVFAVDTSGAAAGTLDTGTVRVKIYFWVLDSLDDAA